MRALLLTLVLATACGDAGAPSHATPEAEPSRAASIVGTTLDAASGESLAGVEVRTPDGRRCLSDERGWFELGGLPTGWSGEITARAADGRSDARGLRPLAAGALEVVLHLR